MSASRFQSVVRLTLALTPALPLALTLPLT